MKYTAIILFIMLLAVTVACSMGIDAPNLTATPPTPPVYTADETADAPDPVTTPTVDTTPEETPEVIPATAETPKPEVFFVQAWREFLASSETDKTVNELYMFTDLDGDGEDEMVAYKEVWKDEEAMTPVPHLTIFDVEGISGIGVPLEINTGYYYYARIYLNALNQIVFEDNIMEGYFSYEVYAYKNGNVEMTYYEKNGQEPDIKDWEDENKLLRPWSEDNHENILRYIGLGQIFHESYDDAPSDDAIVKQLYSDTEKMQVYKQR